MSWEVVRRATEQHSRCCDVCHQDTASVGGLHAALCAQQAHGQNECAITSGTSDAGSGSSEDSSAAAATVAIQQAKAVAMAVAVAQPAAGESTNSVTRVKTTMGDYGRWCAPKSPERAHATTSGVLIKIEVHRIFVSE